MISNKKTSFVVSTIRALMPWDGINYGALAAVSGLQLCCIASRLNLISVPYVFSCGMMDGHRFMIFVGYEDRPQFTQLSKQGLLIFDV